MRSLLQRLADRCRHRLITDRVDKSSPYLSRYYIFGNQSSRWFLALHHIHKGDSDDHLHTHPFHYAAIQLAGSMSEIQPEGIFKRRPGYARVRRRTSRHCLHIRPGNDIWSLFLGFDRRGSWGFMVGRSLVDHRRYLA